MSDGTVKHNVSIYGSSGTINQTLWESLAEGHIRITFYANDTLGNLNFTEVIVIKDLNWDLDDDDDDAEEDSSDILLIGTTMFLIGTASSIGIIVIIRRIKIGKEREVEQ